MLDRNDDGATVADFRLRGECEEDSCTKGDDRGDWGLGWGFVFVVAEGTGVEDAVCTLVVLDGLVAEVYSRLWCASGKFCGIFVKVIKVILISC